MNRGESSLVEVDFTEDPIELRRTLDALDAFPGFAWLEEVAFSYPLTFRVGNRKILSVHSTNSVITIDAQGQPADVHKRATLDDIPVPLAHLVTAAGALQTAITFGRSTWSLPGGGAVSFQVDTSDPHSVIVSGLSALASAIAPIDELSRSVEEVAERARRYLRLHLPPDIWQQWEGSAQ